MPLVNKAMQQFLNEQVNERLKNALGGPGSFVSVTGTAATPEEPRIDPQTTTPETSADDRDEIFTSEEEVEGYRVVRAIVCSEVSAARIAARDTKSYFGVLLDDNNRKPIARLWFNRSKKYLGIFDERKTETRVPITTIEDIYQHADHLRKTVSRYLNDSTVANAPVQADAIAQVQVDPEA